LVFLSKEKVMQRREFLRTTCAFCLAASAGIMVTSLSSCANLPVLDATVIDHSITVPLSAFTQSDYQIIRPNNLLFDIALHKKPDGQFRAIVLQCTHASNQLTPTGEGYTCPAHGSTFDLDGKVTHGPAQLPLRELPTESSRDAVLIRLR
jgi:nitrite reductase/ring-hydroxylating ferredoxin subunit